MQTIATLKGKHFSCRFLDIILIPLVALYCCIENIMMSGKALWLTCFVNRLTEIVTIDRE